MYSIGYVFNAEYNLNGSSLFVSSYQNPGNRPCIAVLVVALTYRTLITIFESIILRLNNFSKFPDLTTYYDRIALTFQSMRPLDEIMKSKLKEKKHDIRTTAVIAG